MRIGVLGGTGPAGKGIAARLAALGHEVVLGSRDRERAEQTVAELQERWGDRVKTLEPGSNAQAADADVVVIATVADAAIPTARYLADELDGKIVVAMANGLVKKGSEFQAVLPDEGSIAEEIQAAAPGAKVVAAFQLVPAAELGDLDRELESDVSSWATTTTPARPCSSSSRRSRACAPSTAARCATPAGSRRSRRRCSRSTSATAVKRRCASEARGSGGDEHPPVRHGQRAVVPFEVGPEVRMYVCGITPYDSTHLGHAATYLTYDILIRRLEELGHEVRMVRNVTDVDDSILPKARELGVPYLELAEAELARFHADMDALELRPPIAEPRATESIDGMIEMISKLLETGHAYLTHGTVYFDVSTFPRFGELSHYSHDEMVRLARDRGGNPDDPHRRSPLDFVLWQPSLPDEPAWRRALRRRAARLARRVLGDVDGTSSVPRSTCTAAAPTSSSRTTSARSRRASRARRSRSRGTGCTRRWCSYEGEKMSKSLGNLVFVSDLLKIADPRAIRLALMRHHYRSGFEWHDTDLDEGTALLHRLLAAAECSDGADPRPFAARVRAAIDDDLDAPSALEALDDLASAILSGGRDPSAPAVLRELGALLGIDLSRPLESGTGPLMPHW